MDNKIVSDIVSHIYVVSTHTRVVWTVEYFGTWWITWYLSCFESYPSCMDLRTVRDSVLMTDTLARSHSAHTMMWPLLTLVESCHKTLVTGESISYRASFLKLKHEINDSVSNPLYSTFQDCMVLGVGVCVCVWPCDRVTALDLHKLPLQDHSIIPSRHKLLVVVSNKTACIHGLPMTLCQENTEFSQHFSLLDYSYDFQVYHHYLKVHHGNYR